MGMGAVHNLLERLGFVRLRDFGLLLTPDRRVVTTRAVLDDGYGSRIVGWVDGDLATMELSPWGTAKPPPPPAKPVPPPPAQEEDEWAWEIAIARARATEPPVPVAAKPPSAREVRPVPGTIIPVPRMPVVDPRLVRTYEPPRRFPRATNPRIAAQKRG